MLCLLRILRKVRKLKHNYIIVMRPKLYTRKKKMKGGEGVNNTTSTTDLDPNVVKSEAMAAAEAKAIADTARNTAETKVATNDLIKDTEAENKETAEEEKEEREAREAQEEREAEKAALIAALKEEIEEIERKLEELTPDITRIYEKSQQIENSKNNNNNKNLTIEELTPEEFEKFKIYIDVYKNLIEKNDELYRVENSSTEEWSFTSLLLAPVKKFFGNLLGNIKKMGAKATTASIKGMTGFVVECYKEIQPNLIEFAQLKNETQLAVTGKTLGAAQLGIDGLAETGPTGELSAAALNGAIETGSPTEAINGATKGLTNQALVMSGPIVDPALKYTGYSAPAAPAAGGGRRSNPNNLREVQKGGLAAAKRVENSIKQFLGLSVSSSHILNMVKRKTMVKRKRESNGIRQSRKRAKKQ